jgi:hypothetical protein
LSDANKLILCSNAIGVTITIPLNASVAFPVGTPVYIEQIGAGQVVVQGDSGVTLNDASSAATRVQYSLIGVVQTATDVWTLFGDMT